MESSFTRSEFHQPDGSTSLLACCSRSGTFPDVHAVFLFAAQLESCSTT